MYNAIAKINEEMQKDPNNRYLEILGQYIIDRCSEKAVADAVNGGKTLEGAYKAVEAVARKKKGQCVVMSDGEIFDAADKYLGVPKSGKARAHTKGEVDGVTSAADDEMEKIDTNAVNLDFSDFLK